VNLAVIVASLLLAPAPATPAVSPVAVPSAAAVPVAAPSAGPAGVAPHTYWIQAQPQDADEKTLHDLALLTSGQGPDAAVQAFAAFATGHPGTVASGLAHVAAGLTLADADRLTEAAAHLRHADVARTALADYAALAVARGIADPRGAGEAYQSVVDGFPDTPLLCPALLGGAEAFERAALTARAMPLAERALRECSGSEPRALLVIAKCHERQRELEAAAEAYDRIDHDFPLSDEAREASVKLRTLGRYLPAQAAGVREARDLKKALLLFDANRPAQAAPLFRTLLLQMSARGARADASAADDSPDLVRVRLGRCLFEMKRWREAQAQLKAVPADSPMAAEADFFLARIEARTGSTAGYERIVARHPGTPWAEEALQALGLSYLKDARFAEATPYFKQMQHDFPDGALAERATWWTGLGEIREGHFEAAAILLEGAARRWASSSLTPGFLFWAAQARLSAGDTPRARALFEETIRRYKYAYHGRRATLALAKLPAVTTEVIPPPLSRAPRPDPGAEIPAPRLLRIRELLLIERLEEAVEELKLQPATSTSQATIAWVHYRRGRLRPAINAMKRAYPEYIGEAADQLPQEVLRIIYPLEYRSELEAQAKSRSLDAALVAALICQESTFDAGARSSVGAHGLMQIMPATGRLIARTLGVRFRPASLHNPEVSLTFGTAYLRDMIDRYEGRVERALAAYNAGPHRVEAWTASRPDVSPEEFTETIPFTETRGYVMSILSMTERYRQIYGLGASAPKDK
jgi:soluble lytic murein transglycosylase